MKRVVVRYKVKADRIDEHEALVRDVFAELEAKRPAGLTYHALKLEDGVSFVHIATIATGDGQNPLTTLASFKAFSAHIADRCDDRPVSAMTTAIGVYPADGAPV